MCRQIALQPPVQIFIQKKAHLGRRECVLSRLFKESDDLRALYVLNSVKERGSNGAFTLSTNRPSTFESRSEHAVVAVAAATAVVACLLAKDFGAVADCGPPLFKSIKSRSWPAVVPQVGDEG